MALLADPRPLLGEPLAIDLLNTRWRGAQGIDDLLAMPGGFELWLSTSGLAERATADAATLAALRQARDALLAAADAGPGESQDAAAARAGLDEVLRHGRVLRAAGATGPVDTVELDDPAWLPAWLAVDNFLSLLATGPDRIRACSGQRCVLHFYDTSQNGRRRWCSMARCGNRAKASRHYAQERRRRLDTDQPDSPRAATHAPGPRA